MSVCGFGEEGSLCICSSAENWIQDNCSQSRFLGRQRSRQSDLSITCFGGRQPSPASTSGLWWATVYTEVSKKQAEIILGSASEFHRSKASKVSHYYLWRTASEMLNFLLPADALPLFVRDWWLQSSFSLFTHNCWKLTSRSMKMLAYQSAHCSPFAMLRWLPVKCYIDFKLLLHTKSLTSLAPGYVDNSLKVKVTPISFQKIF